MAKPSNTLIGKTRGSVGNATFSTWRGVQVLKEKAVVVANPQTPAQMAQRYKFRNANTFYSAARGIVEAFFTRAAVKQIPSNVFASKNLALFEDTGDGSGLFELDMNKLNLSVGSLGLFSAILSSVNATTGVFSVSWSGIQLRYGVNAGDVRVAVMALMPGSNFLYLVEDDVLLSAASVAGTLPDDLTFDITKFYVVLYNVNDRTDCGSTCYSDPVLS